MKKIEEDISNTSLAISRLQSQIDDLERSAIYAEISKDGIIERSKEPITDQFKIFLIGNGYKVEYKKDDVAIKSQKESLLQQIEAKQLAELDLRSKLNDAIIAVLKDFDNLYIWKGCKNLEWKLSNYETGEQLSAVDIFQAIITGKI